MSEEMVCHNLIIDCEIRRYFLGKFCNALLHKNATWTPTTSLTQVVKAVVDHIDHPDIDHSISVG
jgi:ubiquitin-protein ligase